LTAISRLTKRLKVIVMDSAIQIEHLSRTGEPIAELKTLARILARQARLAKSAFPRKLSPAVCSFICDFGAKIGMAFEGEAGEEDFRSALVQIVYCALFADWVLWLKSESAVTYRWRSLETRLQIPFLRELFKEIQDPHLIGELALAAHLDIANETLRHVHIESFRERADLLIPEAPSDTEQSAAAAILHFQEPFLEMFDSAVCE
jgi:hypothetical protein